MTNTKSGPAQGGRGPPISPDIPRFPPISPDLPRFPPTSPDFPRSHRAAVARGAFPATGSVTHFGVLVGVVEVGSVSIPLAQADGARWLAHAGGWVEVSSAPIILTRAGGCNGHRLPRFPPIAPGCGSATLCDVMSEVE